MSYKFQNDWRVDFIKRKTFGMEVGDKIRFDVEGDVAVPTLVKGEGNRVSANVWSEIRPKVSSDGERMTAFAKINGHDHKMTFTHHRIDDETEELQCIIEDARDHETGQWHAPHDDG